jgi:glycosyltransferase involved in cell wall biosynthesis
MRLLFMTGSLVYGGAERHAITLANRLAERGHECHAAYVKNDSSQRERLRGAASVTCLEAKRYLDFAALRRLVQLIASTQPTHIVAANEYAMFYAWLALRRARLSLPAPARLAVTFHSTVLHTLKRRLQMMYYRPLFWSADWLVFVCQAQARYWLRRKVFARRTEVIYNGVDTEHFKADESDRGALRRVLGFTETDLVIGMSAVLRPEKNPLQLLDALALARRRGIAARALFIGDGPMRPAIEARAASLGLARDVVITGLQQDVRPLVRACDAIALCSTTETFSLAALEAMALGRPVLHAQVGGAAEMIEPGRNGYLFAPGDTPALVERLAALADPKLRRRMGAGARETVELRFAEGAMVDRYETGLQELAMARSKREHLRRAASAH